VHTRLRRNERLANKRLQKTDLGDCQEPLLQKGSKRTLSVPSTLRMDGVGMRGTQAGKKKCYTALKRLRRNEPLARERVQQGRSRGCHQPHFKRLERNERAEADHCPSATEVTWQGTKPVNRKRPAPAVQRLTNFQRLSKALKGRTVADRACDSPLLLQGKQRKGDICCTQ
jgi:hypothetical protein